MLSSSRVTTQGVYPICPCFSPHIPPGVVRFICHSDGDCSESLCLFVSLTDLSGIHFSQSQSLGYSDGSSAMMTFPQLCCLAVSQPHRVTLDWWRNTCIAIDLMF